MKVKIKEKDVLKACIDYLKAKGYVYIRNNSGAVVSEYKGKKRLIRYGQKGSADIIVCGKKGEFIAVECKGSEGKLSSEQAEWGSRVNNTGMARYVIVRDIEDLIDGLEDCKTITNFPIAGSTTYIPNDFKIFL